MDVMSRDEARQFFNEGARTAKVATTCSDGSPHVAPVCAAWNDDGIVFTTWHSTVKARNIVRDSRVSICVDADDAFVQVMGNAQLHEDRDAVHRVWLQLGARYRGPDQAELLAERNAVAGELLVLVQPTKVIGHRGVYD